MHLTFCSSREISCGTRSGMETKSKTYLYALVRRASCHSPTIEVKWYIMNEVFMLWRNNLCRIHAIICAGIFLKGPDHEWKLIWTIGISGFELYAFEVDSFPILSLRKEVTSFAPSFVLTSFLQLSGIRLQSAAITSNYFLHYLLYSLHYNHHTP